MSGVIAQTKDESMSRVHILIDGYKLDVTNWIERHPGGAAVIRVFEGRDATEQFNAMHSDKAKQQLKNMLKSKALAQPHALPASDNEAMLKDFELLQQRIKDAGLWHTVWYEQVVLNATVVGLYVAGILLMHHGWSYLGAAVFAWAMQQCGWLGHDYGHHSVFRSVKLNDWVGEAYAWMQGYDVRWWKHRHNIHHVACNEVGHDPDIDLAPLFHFIGANQPEFKPVLNWLQARQHYYYLPFLSLLHMSWRYSSLAHVIAYGMWTRVLALVLHYIFLIYVFAVDGSFLWGPLVFCVVLKGYLTALAVFSTHYSEARLPAGGGGVTFAEQTCLTSRNISGGLLIDLLSGGISRQIEHHLFPMLPRLNLHRVSPMVREFCHAHNLPYHSDNILRCVYNNLQSLNPSAKCVPGGARSHAE